MRALRKTSLRRSRVSRASIHPGAGHYGKAAAVIWAEVPADRRALRSPSAGSPDRTCQVTRELLPGELGELADCPDQTVGSAVAESPLFEPCVRQCPRSPIVDLGSDAIRARAQVLAPEDRVSTRWSTGSLWMKGQSDISPTKSV